MSIAVAVCKNQQTVIATDSLVCFGSGQVTANNYQTDKTLRLGDTIIAATGWALYDNLLSDYIQSIEILPNLHNETTIFRFFVDFWKKMKADYNFINDQCDDKNSPFADLDAQFLLVNAKGIFSVSPNMNVIRFKQYYAIGSGADYALGALHASYDDAIDAASIAHQSVTSAIALDTSCGGDVNLITL